MSSAAFASAGRPAAWVRAEEGRAAGISRPEADRSLGFSAPLAAGLEPVCSPVLPAACKLRASSMASRAAAAGSLAFFELAIERLLNLSAPGSARREDQR